MRELRAADDDQEIVVFGSRVLWSDLLRHGLVDQLHLMIGPKIVTGDARAFTDVPETGLRLRDVRQFDGSELVVLQYDVSPNAQD